MRIIIESLKPKNWGYLLLYFIAKFITYLPFAVIFFLGRIIGYMLYFIFTKRKKIITTNISRCFPNLNETEQKKLIKENIINLGSSLVEFFLALFANDKKLSKLSFIFDDDLKKVDQAIKNRHPLLMIGGHSYSSINELSLRLLYLKTGHKVSVVAKKFKNSFLHEITSKKRFKYVENVIFSSQVHRIVKRLKEGKQIILLFDQDVGTRGIFTPFFDIQTSTTTTPYRIVKLTKADVVFINSFRSANKSYKVEIEVLEKFGKKDIHTETMKINKLLEEKIRKNPAQYLWLYRRFKTRTKEEKIPFYQD